MTEPDTLAEILAGSEDLELVQAALVREKVIRNAMAQTGEGRETIVDMIDALASMDQEAVLSLTEGEPTTLADALRRYVNDLESRHGDYVSPATVAEELGAILAYPWTGEEALVQLHNPHYGLALHVQEGEDRDLEIRMGNNRHLVYTVNWEDAGSGGQREAERVAEAVYRATLARVIADRDHHVQLSASDRRSLLAWLERPNGSWRPDDGGRISLDAAGSGVIVRTRPFAHQYMPPRPPLDQV
jgi:hypothetical protein